MREACLACIGFVLEFLIFYAAGSLLAKILKIKADISFVFILGYLGYFAVFELLIVPMTLLWVPLTTAAYVCSGCGSCSLGNHFPEKKKQEECRDLETALLDDLSGRCSGFTSVSDRYLLQ